MASNPTEVDATFPSSTSTSYHISNQTPSEPSLPALEFQFVNISEPTEIHRSRNRKLVRSSVAQNLRRQQLLRHSEGSPHACIDPDVASMFPVLNFCPVCGYSFAKKKSHTRSIDQPSASPVPVIGPEPNNMMGLGAGKVDPFGAFPIPIQPYMHLLVDHYVSDYSSTFQPFCKWDITTSPIIIRLFRGFALQQPVYFHATLCIAATHLNLTSGRAVFQTLAAYHRGESIKLLNTMLQDMTHGITDLMIAVVGSLANHDIMVGDQTALVTHRNGLVEMIKQRGGIQHHSLMCLLRYRSIWIDFMSAVFSHSMPLFPDDAQFKPTRPIEIISIATTGFHNLVNSSNLSSPMIEILEEVTSLTHEILRLRGMRATPEEMKSTTSRRARVERALYTSQFNISTRGGDVQHCIRLAALIYAYCVFRKTTRGSAILSSFNRQLQLKLEGTDILSLWDGNLEALLWVLFMGGIAVPVSDTATKEKYISWLILLCYPLEVHTWEKAKEFLKRYLWSEDDLEKDCKNLWSEVVVNLRFS